MPRPLEEAVVAITGASSGIGRAAALRFARRGSSLALCSRSQRPLEEVAGECERLGAPVLHSALDVRDEDAVERFAAATVERFGRIDVWVGNAGVIAYGDFIEVPSETFKAVIETNFFGQVHGARAALRRFREQENGVLICMSSVWGRVSSPDVAAYVASKNAVRAFAECLRGELAGEPGIHVTTLAPQAVDTPIFDHAANHAGYAVRPIPPIVPADEVAAGIEACAESPKEEVNYGRAGRLLEAMFVLTPKLYRRIAHPAFVSGTFAPRRVPRGDGNVAAPAPPHRVDGRWRSSRRRLLWRALLGAGTASVSGLIGGERRSRRASRPG